MFAVVVLYFVFSNYFLALVTAVVLAHDTYYLYYDPYCVLSGPYNKGFLVVSTWVPPCLLCVVLLDLTYFFFLLVVLPALCLALVHCLFCSGYVFRLLLYRLTLLYVGFSFYIVNFSFRLHLSSCPRTFSFL
jgi:hypothetical protein